MSCYIPAYTRINGKHQESACGRWLLAKDHSNEPTCQHCQEYLAQDADLAVSMAASFGLVIQDGLMTSKERLS